MSKILSLAGYKKSFFIFSKAHFPLVEISKMSIIENENNGSNKSN
ncbi:hypothetical protein CEV31_0009 [Brucella thiophenivorans]|uniref:Uncharacterized protein n=1 Tax=Brucella thiophenivorans TaxID=571255 RepID=A0A256G8L1_9HYPH|nr:hypothetical protein CEV31_0009 [Brucella thiophenivorans]